MQSKKTKETRTKNQSIIRMSVCIHAQRKMRKEAWLAQSCTAIFSSILCIIMKLHCFICIRSHSVYQRIFFSPSRLYTVYLFVYLKMIAVEQMTATISHKLLKVHDRIQSVSINNERYKQCHLQTRTHKILTSWPKIINEINNNPKTWVGGKDG